MWLIATAGSNPAATATIVLCEPWSWSDQGSFVVCGGRRGGFLVVFACCGGFFVGCVLAFAGVWGLASAVSWAKGGFEAVAVRAFALAAPADVQYVLGLLLACRLDKWPMNPGMLLSPFGVHRSAAVGIAQGLVRIAAVAGQDGVAAKIGGLRA